MRADAIVLARGDVTVRLTTAPDLTARLAELEPKIAAAWAKARQEQPCLYDAPVPHFLELEEEGTRIELRAAVIGFRQLHAARRHPEWGLGLTPIGINGTTLTKDGHVVFARRAAFVSQDPGRWELAPSGHLSPPFGFLGQWRHEPDLLAEFEEELGMKRSRVTAVHTLGVLRDNWSPMLDICCLLRVNALADEIQSAMVALAPRQEYAEAAFVPLDQAQVFAAARELTPSTRSLLTLLPKA